MKQSIALLLCLTLSLSLSSQANRSLSPSAEISLLTMGPGDELVDKFGHSALRVSDASQGIDLVFNYGVYDFSTPNFYTKFAQGKLLYLLAVSRYTDFVANYKSQERWIQEQELNLTPEQRQEVFSFLKTNAHPSNRAYKYDFFYDNCATRPLAVVEQTLGEKLQLDFSSFPENKTHRMLIRERAHWNTWGMLGIDVALGSVIDRQMDPKLYTFLPDYVMDALAKASVNYQDRSLPLVKATNAIYSPENTHGYSFSVVSPIVVFGILSLFIIFITYKDQKNTKITKWLDVVILGISGVIGILLTLLWFATDHTATAWNYNLLWAFPFNLLAAFVISKTNPPRWIYPYVKLLLILLALLFFHWIVGVQSFSWALLPLLLALIYRYRYVLRTLKALR